MGWTEQGSRIGIVLAPGLVLGLVACSEGGPSHPPSEAATDSAGVRIVDNTVPQWGPGEGWRVTSEPVLSLGVVDTPLAQQFHNIEGVTRMRDGTIVVLNTGSGEVRAFDSGGNHLWSTGGLGPGPGEMSDHLGKRLLRLKGDTLLVIDQLFWIILGPDGQLVDERREPGEGGCRKIPAAGEHYLACGNTRSDEVPGPWTRESTIVRLDGDRVDSIGPFFLADGWRDRSDFMRSPLGPKGTLKFARNEPTLLYARNDAYRIEFWDLAAGSLSMVVERQTALRARTEVEIVLTLPWSMVDGVLRPTVSADDDRLSVADSLSIVDDFFLDELGFLWVRREPSPSEGDLGIRDEVFTPDGADRIGVVWNPSGLHDVFRPDGVYLGTVQLPGLGRVEIGADHVLGVNSDEWGIQYVRVFGLDRGEDSPASPSRAARPAGAGTSR